VCVWCGGTLELKIQRLVIVRNKTSKKNANNALSSEGEWCLCQPCRHFSISTNVNKNPGVRAPMRTNAIVRLSLSLCRCVCLVTFILRPLKVEQRIFLFGLLTNSGNCIMHDALGYFSAERARRQRVCIYSTCACVGLIPV
jgi:hypothetical protein